ncbi:MAG TPA: hypothetical protein VFJ24_08335 [Gaiellales bacterium]|nr:hypothetical protein [Gaiellales bacterium]
MKKLFLVLCVLVTSVVAQSRSARAQGPLLIDNLNVMYQVPGQPAMAPFCPAVWFWIDGNWLVSPGAKRSGADLGLPAAYANYTYCSWTNWADTYVGTQPTYMLMDCTRSGVHKSASVNVIPSYPTVYDFTNPGDLTGSQQAINDVWGYFYRPSCQLSY